MKNEKTKDKKKTKIIFNEKVDSAINGFTLGFALLIISAFLFYKSDYFTNPFVTYILGAIFGAIGFLGTSSQMSESLKIKGMDTMAIGVVLSTIWYIAYVKISTLWANIVFFPILFLGVYAIIYGILQTIYTIYKGVKSILKHTDGKKSGAKASITQIVLFLTQLCSLGLAIVNILKAFNLFD